MTQQSIASHTDDSSIDPRIRAAREGSTEALGRLMETCQRYLLLVANRELDAELRAKGGASDLVQETFMEAQRDFLRFEGRSEADLLAWLRRLLLNNMHNFSRRYRTTGKRAVGREVSIDGGDSERDNRISIAADTQSPSQCLIDFEESKALLDALDRIPEHYREVILLRHREGYSYTEIGLLLDRTPEAVRKLWSRAIERLQQEMDAPDDRA